MRKSRIKSNSMGILVVVFGVKGGLSDVGKYAVKHALRHNGDWTVRLIALSGGQAEGYETLATVDPGKDTGPAIKRDQRELKDIITAAEVLKIDIKASTAQQQLEDAFQQADVVVSAIGSRENSLPRYLNLGVSKITQTMKAKNVPRLIQLSSMGIGEDFVPIQVIRVFWAVLLRTFFRTVHKDLKAMEATVHASDVDFVLVRPAGIPPDSPPKGTWQLLKSKEDRKPVGFVISKSDVALFMIEEAIHPTLHKTAVTIAPKEIKR